MSVNSYTNIHDECVKRVSNFNTHSDEDIRYYSSIVELSGYNADSSIICDNEKEYTVVDRIGGSSDLNFIFGIEDKSDTQSDTLVGDVLCIRSKTTTILIPSSAIIFILSNPINRALSSMDTNEYMWIMQKLAMGDSTQLSPTVKSSSSMIMKLCSMFILYDRTSDTIIRDRLIITPDCLRYILSKIHNGHSKEVRDRYITACIEMLGE